MPNTPIHIRLEDHVIDMIDAAVAADNIEGTKGLSGGRAEWGRRLIHGHFGIPLPKQSQYLPGAGAVLAGGKKRAAKPMKANPGVLVAKKLTKDEEEKVLKALEAADVPGQILLTVVDDPVSSSESDPSFFRDVAEQRRALRADEDAAIVDEWDTNPTHAWTDMPSIMRDRLGYDLSSTWQALRGRYRRAKARQVIDDIDDKKDGGNDDGEK